MARRATESAAIPYAAKKPIFTPASCTTSLSLSLRACGPIDRPFEVGDWVVIEDVEGTVEELGFRSTRVRTFYNSQVTVPNSTLVRSKVDNYGRRTYRR